MERMALIAAVVFLPMAVASGCDSAEDDADGGAATMDASSSSSDSGGPEADGSPPSPDAAAAADAAVDAAATRDGSSGDVEAVCTTVCEHLDTCFEEGDVPACVTDCTADLADCSAGELDAVINCTTVPCPGMNPCMSSVPCTTTD